MNKLIRDCRNNMKNLSPGLEALLFSIYYASITSMEDEEVGPLIAFLTVQYVLIHIIGQVEL